MATRRTAATTQLPQPGNIIDGRYRVEEQIGRGGAGKVYKVTQLGVGITRALKWLSPDEPEQLDLFTKTFDEEIRLLSQLTHKNVVKIIDASTKGSPVLLSRGAKPDSSREINNPYYVMDYIDGGTLLDAFQAPLTSLEVIGLFANVLGGAAYLHARDVLHGDIKPPNIVVARTNIAERTILEAKISDLGVAKQINRAPLLLPRDDKTYVHGSTTYLPSYAADVVDAAKPIRRDQLRHWLPHVDLFSAGATFAGVLTDVRYTNVELQFERMLKEPKPAIRRAFANDDWEYLCAFIRRLLIPTPMGAYTSTDEARDALLRIDARRAVTMHVPDLTPIGSEHRIVLESVVVRLSGRAHNVVSHSMFQRLRRLNQLNFVEMIYPDARHSRFAHSMQAFEVAKRVVEHLLGNRHFRLNATAADINAFLVAALTHDVGHYPLTHAIEDLRPDQSLGVKADFEMLGPFLRRGASSLAAVIERDWNVTPETITALAGKDDKSVSQLNEIQEILKLLLDGPIDVDKIAYLTEDSRHTGVAYGSGIDADALVGALTIISDDRKLRLALEHKGLSPADSVVAARYHMFARVYWHHTNRAIMAMLRYVFERVFKAADANGQSRYSFGQYIEDTIGYSDLEATRLVASKFVAYFPGEGNPLTTFLSGDRALYKRLVSFSYNSENHDLNRCHKFLMSAPEKRLRSTIAECRKALEKTLGHAISEDRLLVDIPRLAKEEDAGGVVDLPVIDPHTGKSTGLRNFSHASKAVYDDFESVVKKSRLFIHPATRQQLRTEGKEEIAAKAVEGVILAKARKYV